MNTNINNNNSQYNNEIVTKLMSVFKRPITLEEYKEKHGYDYLERGFYNNEE